MSDYLWDKEGEPDPEVAELEQLLRPLAHRGPAPQLPSLPSRRRVRPVWIVAGLAAAALLALLVKRPWRPNAPPGAGTLAQTSRASWPAEVSGEGATADGQALAGATRLWVGAWLETGPSRVQLRVGAIGTVELAAGTRARIVESGPERQQLQLERGSLTAHIDAPPRRFAVATPHALVTDLGCAFSLTVDAAGGGRLVVTDGRVAISDGGASELVVPAGAECALTARGPGVPLSSAASADFRAALARYEEDPTQLAGVLAAAGPAEQWTLRQLVARAGSDERARVQARLDELERAERPESPRSKPAGTPRHPAPKRTPGVHATPAAGSAANPAATRPASNAGPASKPAPATGPASRPAPRSKLAPAHPPAPADTKLHHDALEGLERSIQ